MDAVDLEVLIAIHFAGGPADLERFHALPCSQSEMQPGVVARKEATTGPNMIVLHQVSGRDLHLGSHGTAVAHGSCKR